MRRVFMISNRNCKGPVGGAGGVNYKVYRANCKYGLIPEMQNVFRDKILTVEENYIWDRGVLKVSPKRLTGVTYLKYMLLKTGIGGIAFEILRLIRWTKQIREYNKRLHFSNEDIYIFHDVESALCFCRLYGCDKSVLVYHHQGSLYNERSEFYGINSRIYRWYMARLTEKTFKIVKDVGFPSKGAMECLVESEPILKPLIEAEKVQIFYNGVENCEGSTQCELSSEQKAIIKQISESRGIKFATVSTLNASKAVERIPEFLAKFKKNDYDFIWILVGNGIGESIVESEIDKYGIRDKCIWIKEAVQHEVILNIFCNTDFYLILHKFSIFDYAILEAMSCGNIPLLSRIGGNKEVITQNNGFFSDEPNVEYKIYELAKGEKANLMKKKNIELQRSNFSEFSSLNYYKSWCDLQ